MGRPKFRRLTYDLYERMEGARLPGSTYQILLIIFDYTLGYRKDEAPISLTTFQDKSNLSRQGVIKAIKDAERRRIIRASRKGTSPKTGTSYAINFDMMDWLTGKQEWTRTSKPELTGKLVNGASPDWSSNVDQTSQ